MKERGVDIEEISATFMSIPPRVNNLLLYLLCIWRPPPWLWKRLLKRVQASTEEQKHVPAPRPRPAHGVPVAARAEPPREDGLLGDPRPLGLHRLADRPRSALWRKRFTRAHAAPAAPRARDRQGRPRRAHRGRSAAAGRGPRARPPSAGRASEAESPRSLPRDHVAYARLLERSCSASVSLMPMPLPSSWSISPTYCSSTELTPTRRGGGSACHCASCVERAGVDLVAREVELELGLDGRRRDAAHPAVGPGRRVVGVVPLDALGADRDVQRRRRAGVEHGADRHPVEGTVAAHGQLTHVRRIRLPRPSVRARHRSNRILCVVGKHKIRLEPAAAASGWRRRRVGCP